MPADTVIAVMTRTTVPGAVKTRLMPVLGALGAARLHAELTRRTLSLAMAAAPAAIDVWMASDTAALAHPVTSQRTQPPPGDPAFEQAMALDPRSSGIRWRYQGPGDLGARMRVAACCGLGRLDPTADEAGHLAAASAQGVLIIGTDCPSRGIEDLAAGRAALRDHDAVLQPATDGGYVMIGLRQSACHAIALDALFSGLPWGSATVLAETLERAQRAGLRVALLRPLPDLDTPADLTEAIATGLLGVAWGVRP